MKFIKNDILLIKESTYNSSIKYILIENFTLFDLYTNLLLKFAGDINFTQYEKKIITNDDTTEYNDISSINSNNENSYDNIQMKSRKITNTVVYTQDEDDEDGDDDQDNRITNVILGERLQPRMFLPLFIDIYRIFKAMKVKCGKNCKDYIPNYQYVLWMYNWVICTILGPKPKNDIDGICPKLCRPREDLIKNDFIQQIINLTFKPIKIINPFDVCSQLLHTISGSCLVHGNSVSVNEFSCQCKSNAYHWQTINSLTGCLLIPEIIKKKFHNLSPSKWYIECNKEMEKFCQQNNTIKCYQRLRLMKDTTYNTTDTTTSTNTTSHTTNTTNTTTTTTTNTHSTNTTTSTNDTTNTTHTTNTTDTANTTTNTTHTINTTTTTDTSDTTYTTTTNTTHTTTTTNNNNNNTNTTHTTNTTTTTNTTHTTNTTTIDTIHSTTTTNNNELTLISNIDISLWPYCLCHQNFTGLDCSIPFNPCDHLIQNVLMKPQILMHNQLVHNDIDRPLISFDDGDEDDDLKSATGNWLYGVPFGYGTCHSSGFQYRCQCKIGYEKDVNYSDQDNCWKQTELKTIETVHECGQSVCLNGGECVYVTKGLVTYIDQYNNDTTNSTNSNNDSSYAYNRVPMCQCQPGYTGLYCELTGVWSDWNSWSDCQPNCGLKRYRSRLRSCYGDIGCIGSGKEIQNCPPRKCITVPLNTLNDRPIQRTKFTGNYHLIWFLGCLIPIEIVLIIIGVIAYEKYVLKKSSSSSSASSLSSRSSSSSSSSTSL